MLTQIEIQCHDVYDSSSVCKVNMKLFFVQVVGQLDTLVPDDVETCLLGTGQGTKTDEFS